jgi:hypothetical protein
MLLGRFLEAGLAAADPPASWDWYQRAGFAGAATGDIWPYPYGVVCCEGIAIGLHSRSAEPLTLYFVREDIAALHRELTVFQVPVEDARLGIEIFNELTLRDPTGVAVRVLAARSFSPPHEMPATTTFGRFLELSLPARDLDAVAEFWLRLGASVEEITDPWEGIAVGNGTGIGYHAWRDCPEPLLAFSGTAGRTQPPEGFTADKALPSLASQKHQVFRSPEGVALLTLARF